MPLLLLAMSLVACGGGGGDSGASVAVPPAVDPAAQALDQSYYPAAIGDTWVHTVRGFSFDRKRESVIAGTKTIGAVTALELRETTQGGNSDPSVAYVLKDSRAYTLVSNGTTFGRFPFQSGDLMRFDGTFGAVLNESLDLDSGRDLDGDGRNERVDRRVYGVVEGYETLVVPAGTFPDTGRVRYDVKLTTRYSAGAAATVETYPAYREWRAPRWGLVQWETFSLLSDSQTEAVLSGAVVGGAAVGSVTP